MNDGKEPENTDYYIDENGNCVFTEAYHLARGCCCENGCRHCPFSPTSRSDNK